MLRLIVATIALAGIGLTAALGGFDQVVPPEPDPVPVAVGEEFNGGPWLVTIESAEIGYNLRGHTASGEDRTLVLQVNARVEVIDNRSRYAMELHPMVDFTQVAGVRDGFSLTPLSLRDNSLVSDLQPGLPERIAFVQELENDTPVPDEVTILIGRLDRTYEFWSFIGGTIEHDRPSGAVVVPVVDRTATT
jgi:hypothetical protein